MTDMERLTEALEQIDRYSVTLKESPELKVAVDAARLLVNGQRVEWCDIHGAESREPEVCLLAVYSMGFNMKDCRIVSMLLVDIPDAEVSS